MNQDKQELKALLDFAVELSQEAGEITLKHFRRLASVEKKKDGSFVTIADRESERFLRDAINSRFPDDAIVGEEEGIKDGTSGRRWILDPIDGTFSFVHGVPLYGVLIGVEINDEPTIGVINIPGLNEVVYAGRGLGCFYNGEPTRVSDTSAIEEALLLSSDFGPNDKHEFNSVMLKLQAKASDRRSWGDCYGHLLIATGRADVMLDPLMNVWDCAALMPVIEEAGGTFTDWSGKRTIHGGNAISTNGKLYESVMNIISNRSEL
ncbi:MAG TPA: inositol monophosphatase family protein [Blastocatellia bacterium]|nr:inositol monophosphatase family protein [Blastocatellia bacterium]